MTKVSYDIAEIRADALELDSQGKPIEHTGLGRGVFKLKLPMTADHAKNSLLQYQSSMAS
jgi:hypothetical protein